MADLPTDPVVGAFVAAINDGDRAAFDALLAPGVTMSDDGTDRDVADWTEREIFAADGRMTVESEEGDGTALVATFTNSTWGAMRTRWRFTIEGGRIIRFETGQA
jgi:hypothetical protein